MYKKTDVDNEWVMCANKRCCPVVKIEGDTVYITDDFDSVVKMDLSQFFEIRELINELEKK